MPERLQHYLNNIPFLSMLIENAPSPLLTRLLEMVIAVSIGVAVLKSEVGDLKDGQDKLHTEMVSSDAEIKAKIKDVEGEVNQLRIDLYIPKTDVPRIQNRR